MKLSKFNIKLGGLDAVVTGGDVEFTDANANTPDTLAGALYIEDPANIAVFDELKHEEEVDGKTYIASYGVNAEKILTEKEDAPKAKTKPKPKAK